MAPQPLRQDAFEPRRQPAVPSVALPRRRVAPDPAPSARVQRLVQRRILALVAVLLATALGFFVVSQYAAIMVNNYEIESLQSNLQQQDALNASLQGKVSQLSSPTRVLNYAENVLKMRPATPVIVGDGNH